MYKFNIDDRGYQEAIRAIGKNSPKYLTRGIRSGSRQAGTRIRSFMRKSTRVRHRMAIQRINPIFTSKRNPHSILMVIGANIRFKWLQPKWLKSGMVTYFSPIKKKRVTAQPIGGNKPFIATMRNSFTSIFYRKGRSRLPIKEYPAETFPEVFSAHGKNYYKIVHFVVKNALNRELNKGLVKLGKVKMFKVVSKSGISAMFR